MRALLGVGVALLLAGAAQAQTYDPIRSDLPLLITNRNPDVYPRNFEDGKDFGSLFIPIGGDWTCAGSNGQGCDDDWLIIKQDGVIHPKYMVWWAAERPAVNAPTPHQIEISFTSKLGEAARPDGKVALYDLQVGMRGGSTHLLMAWLKEGKGIERIELLDAECHDRAIPGVEWRHGDGGGWITDYCAVRSIDALKVLAQDAVKRPPIAILTRASRRPGEDSPAQDDAGDKQKP